MSLSYTGRPEAKGSVACGVLIYIASSYLATLEGLRPKAVWHVVF